MNTLNRPILIWLITGILLITAMVFIGGITRLTHSGLSMVTWKPATGFIPPLDEEAWNTEFDKYKEFPEYKTVNRNMTLSGFKGIYFWEYLHRLLGRITGLAFIIPFGIFFFQKRFSPELLKKLIIILFLGGFQGFLGWYMVKSGLVDRPDVSHYRLAIHLLTAFILVAYLFWTSLWVFDGEPELKKKHPLYIYASVLLGLVLLQIIYGAFTAGLDGAFGYNTFPLMGGKIIPDGYNMLSPFWINLVENRFMVQFLHRTIGWLLVAGAVYWYLISKNYFSDKKINRSTRLFNIWLVGQFLMGVFTLIFTQHEIPIDLAVLHQAGALVMLLTTVNILYSLKS